MRRVSRIIAALAAAASFACASETRVWSLGGRSDFEKSTLQGLSLTSDGRITLAPVFKEVFDSASVYLWALAEDSKGNVYAGGGGPGGPGARLYLIPPDGPGKTVADFGELEIHAVAVDAKDQVYAATSPDGKVYRIRNGKAEVFYDPKAKYIWGMGFNSRGDLFVATGDRGEVHKVAPDGKGSVFYNTSETHARSLAIDKEDNLIVGTDPGGLIVRISPKGEGFVLYQTDKREVTAVALGANGAIYAAAVGTKQAAGTAPAITPPVVPAAKPLANPAGTQQPAPAAAPAAPRVQAPVAQPSPAISGGSEVYRIDRDGAPRRIWSNPRDIAYAIGFDRDQHPLIATGNKGVIYRIDSDLVYTELLDAPPAQVTALRAGRSGRIYAATGNVGKVYVLGPALEKSGTIESDVFDADMFSQWGRLSWRGRENGGRISFQTRTGNLDRPVTDWSPWSAQISGGDGGNITSPKARFIQWRATLGASPEGGSPVLDAIDVAYLPRNAAPVVKEIEITPANYRFPAAAAPLMAQPASLTLPPLGGAPQRSRNTSFAALSTPSMQYAKGFLGARWSAADDNGDTLSYDVYVRGEGESDWKLLKARISEPHISWDSTAFPDGEYRLRVVASDAPDNAPDRASTGELVSDPFTIDNTPPEITGLTAAPAGSKVQIRWSARDARNVIERAEYSINGGDWTFVEPVTQLSDSREESYTLTIDRPGPGELTFAVRVSDEFDNRAVAKTVVRP